jgi:hypothetical protein
MRDRVADDRKANRAALDSAVTAFQTRSILDREQRPSINPRRW